MSWFVSVSRRYNTNRSWRKKTGRNSTLETKLVNDLEQRKEGLKCRHCNENICRPARDTNLEEDNKDLQEFLIPLWIRTSFRIIWNTILISTYRTLFHDVKKARDSIFYFSSVPIASQFFFYPWLLYCVIVKITTLFERRENWLQTDSMEEPRVWKTMHCRLCINCYGTG